MQGEVVIWRDTQGISGGCAARAHCVCCGEEEVKLRKGVEAKRRQEELIEGLQTLLTGTLGDHLCLVGLVLIRFREYVAK